MNSHQNSRLPCAFIFVVPAICVALSACAKNENIVFGTTTLESVIKKETAEDSRLQAVVEKTKSAAFPTETLRFTSDDPDAKTRTTTYTAQNKIVIGRHRQPTADEAQVANWVHLAQKNNWSYNIQPADRAPCGHINDEIFRIPARGLSVRYNSISGTVERITEGESRHAD